MRWAGRFLAVVLVAAGLALLASYGGALHPAGDSLAVVRPVLIALLVVLAAIVAPLGWRRLAPGAGALAGLAAVHLWLGLPAGAMVDAEVTVYSKNLWAGNIQTGAIEADILSSGANVVLLQEVSDLNRDILVRLAAEFPHQHLCRFSRWSGIAILSRWPLDTPRCTRSRAAAMARVLRPGGALTAVSVHLPWPWPYPQATAAAVVAELVAGASGDLVIGGDFNMMPWGRAPLSIAQAARVRPLGPMAPTYRVRGFPVIIDHMMTTGQGSLETRPQLNSDHHGLVARIGF